MTLTPEVLAEAQYVRGLLVRAIEEKGADYVYPDSERAPTIHGGPKSCQYFVNGRPSCIVGHVLHYLGRGYALEGHSAWAVTADLHWTDHVRNALLRAQAAQDSGSTWGKALEEFDAHLKRLGLS